MAETLVTVASYPQSFLAHAAGNMLAEHGIRAFLADEHMADQSWVIYCEAKLQVAAADAERAIARSRDNASRPATPTRAVSGPV